MAVEYRSEHWSHPVYPEFWRVGCYVGRPSPILRALRMVSVHEAPANRATQLAGITDAARQAFFAYRSHFFHLIQHDALRYFPRRVHGEIGARVATTAGEDPWLRSTVQLMAVLNTELNFALLEMRQMRLQAEEDRTVIAQLQTQLTGVAPPVPQWSALSPARDFIPYGAAGGRTRIG